jgi:metal-responsive CopG/Arc/MetJ family transcriptional regulator
MPRFTIEVPQETKDELDRIRQKKGLSLSKTACILLQYAIREKLRKTKPKEVNT